MTEGAKDLTPVGVSLTSESCSNHDNQQYPRDQDANLGFILVNQEETVVCDLRDIIGQHLETVPVSYRFLTKQGWPVRPKQEGQIKACHLVTEDGLIRIQRDYGEPRVGVVCESGTALGFVFMSSLQLTINKLRQAVLAQSKDVPVVLTGPSSSQRSQDSNKVDPTLPESTPCSLGSMRELLPDDWIFLDRNGWPVNRQQESTLTILDILVQSSVKVRVHSSLPELRGHSALEDSHTSFTSTMADFGMMTPPSKMQRVSKSPSNLTSLDTSFTYSPHKMQPRNPLTTNPDMTFISKTPTSVKQILISYVRAEATQYALDLKSELEELKFSVYLDVHEIFCGTDWQDSLNFAVSNCAVFVPLVTPRYGETQWTNREVKLADVLGKYIVPVSFLDTWPPRCLAIQFATTQFINWRKPKPGQPSIAPHSPTKDPSMDSPLKKCYEWEKKDVTTVAKDIGKRCQTRRIANGTNGVAPLTRGKTMSVGEILNEGREEGDSLLVISTHPKQEEFGAELKKLFESKGYDVWMTTELSRMGGTDTESDGTLILDGNEDTMDGICNPATLFQEKVDEASVVLFVLSKAFAESATCKGQVFYCEQRKRVVPLAYEDFEMPGWMSMLIGTSTFENVKRGDYKDHLLTRIAQACDPATLIDAEDIAKEKELSVSVEFVCKNLPDTGCVYIAGGTKYYYEKSQAICKAIGEALAKLPTVTLITGGFYGVGQDVSKSFYDERKRLRMEPKVWHILPKKDMRDCTAQANQKPDKSFKGPPFGKTLCCGEDVRQRESIVSKVFDICIIVEGGPGAAHEAEEFTWSDHTVIPIKCTGGAAGGKFKVPHKIFELPPGVARDDWQLLSNKSVSAVEIGAAVARIVRSLQEGVISQVTCQKSFRRRPSLMRGKSLQS